MTTEVAVREDQASAIAVRETAVLATLADWAAEARAAAAIAKSLCDTSFVPKHFRGNPAEATAAILTGHELGLSPMASLRSIYVIGGTPAMYAIALRAVVQSKGHQIWVEEASATRVVVHGRRAGSDRVESSEWTFERAKTAELLTNPQYKKNPRNMLTARATVEVCRLIAADAIHGIPYAVEELDGEPSFSPAPTATRVTAAEILGDPAPTPAESQQLENAPVTTPVDTMTKPQQGKLFALLKERGFTDKEAALAFIADVIGRRIASRNELTRAETGDVIDRLDSMLTVDQRDSIVALAAELGLSDQDALIAYVAATIDRNIAWLNDLTEPEASAVLDAMLAAKNIQDSQTAPADAVPERSLRDVQKAQGESMQQVKRAVREADGGDS